MSCDVAGLELPATIRFAKRDRHFRVNGMLIQRFIDAGQQSFGMVVQESFTKKYLYSFLEGNYYTRMRLRIHELLRDCAHVVRVLGSRENVSIDVSEVPEDDRGALRRVRDGMTLVVYEYVPYDTLSYATLEAGADCIVNNNNRGADFPRVLAYFRRIVECVRDIHGRNVFHFDLKPENILASADDFRLIDFGSAQIITERGVDGRVPNVLLPGEARIAYVIQTTELFAPSKYDSADGYIVADRFDVYSLGCILYHMLTNDFLAMPLMPNSPQFDFLLKLCGPLITDLVAGMTHKNMMLRYTIEQILKHPAFQMEQADTTIREEEEDFQVADAPPPQRDSFGSLILSPQQNTNRLSCTSSRGSYDAQNFLPQDLFAQLTSQYNQV